MPNMRKRHDMHGHNSFYLYINRHNFAAHSLQPASHFNKLKRFSNIDRLTVWQNKYNNIARDCNNYFKLREFFLCVVTLTQQLRIYSILEG